MCLNHPKLVASGGLVCLNHPELVHTLLALQSCGSRRFEEGGNGQEHEERSLGDVLDDVNLLHLR